MRRITIAAMGAVVALGLAACSGSGAGSTDDESGAAADPGDLTVGVAMPTQTSERWIADGDAVEKGLKEAGYKVDLQFAGDDIPTQQQQIDQMITKGADLLIIASIDGTALATQLQAAADANIPVIAYDRLIRDSENVDFYVTFDNYKVGVQQATSLLVGLGILKADGSKGDAAGSVQHRAVRRLAGRQQRALLLPGRDGHPAGVHRRRHARREVGPDRHRAGRDAALAAGDRPEAHGGPADVDLLRRQQGRRASCPRTTACPAASSPRCRTPATARPSPTACRSSPARTRRSRRSS